MQQAKRFPTGGGSSPCPSSPSPSVSSPVVRARRPSSLSAGRGVRAVVSARPVRRSVVRRSSVSRPSPSVASSGRGVVVLSSCCPVVPVAPPVGGVVRRVKRKGARGLVKVLSSSGSSVGSVGVGRRCRGRGSRSFLFPLSGAVGSRPSCRRVRPVRPCPPVVGVAYRRGLSVRVPWFGVAVGRGVGRCRSCGGVGCSRSRVVAVGRLSVRRGRGRGSRLSPFGAGRGRLFVPVPPCGGSSWGVGRRVPLAGGGRLFHPTPVVYAYRHNKSRPFTGNYT